MTSYLRALHGFASRYSFVIRYGIAGVCGAFLQTSTLYIWVSVLGFQNHYLWGVVIGFSIALLVTFLLQKYWTFRDRPHHHVIHLQFFFYIVAALIALGMNALLLHLSKQALEGLGFDFFHGWYLGAQIIIIFVVAVGSFLMNYFITFKASQLHREE